MTQEEKAKAYDEVLNKLRYFMAKGVDPLITRADVQDFFPELLESEDERIRKEIIELVMQPTWKTEKEFNRRNELCEWLEKQGKTSPILYNSSNIGKVEQKQEWSEEDKEIIDYLIDYLESELDSSYTDLDKETFIKEITWLKSLRPQNTWKPSKEQLGIIAQSIAVLKVSGYGELGDRLGEISEQLNKLKEE